MADSNETVIVDKNRGFRVWNMSEIYFPEGSGNGQYVPNEQDMVVDWNQGFFRVVDVDYTTYVVTLQKWTPPADSEAVTDEDILLGAGPGVVAESFRAFLDLSVFPHTLGLDSRLHMYGSNVTYFKVFKGTDLTPGGEVISQYYDQSGVFLGENVPMELVSTPNPGNVAIKAPKVAYTTYELADGEVVTAVFYNAEGGAQSTAKLLIKQSQFMRTTDASRKYVTGISLLTPFMNPSNPKEIRFPINMPVLNLNLMGRVSYSDGSYLDLPIDGTKFSISGLDNYISSIQGQRLPLVLHYHLSPGEYSYIGQTPSPEMHISEAYWATTAPADGSYSVKLFSFPVFVDQLNGYRLEHFLYNLNRHEVYNVTNLVQLQSGSRAFNPTEYGIVQRVTMAIDLNRVDSKFAAYRHAQTFDFTLLTDGTLNSQDNWTIAFSPGQTPPYGVGVQAISQFIDANHYELDITCGCETLTEWLDKVFYATQPLFDPGAETKAPAPNFFVLRNGNTRTEFPIDQWRTLLQVSSVPAEGRNVYIEFLRRDAVTDKQLGIAGLVVHYAGT